MIKLKECRKSNKLTQREISNYLDVSRGNYAMYECGSNTIPLLLLDKLSLKYNVSISYLVGLDDNTNNKIKPMDFSLMNKRLKEQRKKLGYSQKEISNYLNITQSHYSSYEKGRNTIPITKLIELSKLYNISIDYLMGKLN